MDFVYLSCITCKFGRCFAASQASKDGATGQASQASNACVRIVIYYSLHAVLSTPFSQSHVAVGYTR